MPLIECVPNFSEGRDVAVVDAIVAAMLAVEGVYLLAREMDADHHRSVITLAGEAAQVAEAAVRGVGEAARRIDLRRHKGAHPRLGAADVVPFVPLQGATLEECVRWAEWAGAEIWRRFRVPVYLYEAAARRPERRQLEAVRRGQFEGLSELVRTDPDKLPDFGPRFEHAALHPSAGATIVGARNFLIAYNINLDTADMETGRAIARAIRASGGGLPAVKAMGVRLDDPPRAQVSMNLTDFTQTSLATVWRAVNDEAAKRGVTVQESELIGLIPRAALEGAAAELVRFREFDPSRVVENRVEEVMRQAAPSPAGPSLQAQLAPVLAALAASAPVPGGGAAAAVAGALAAAVGAMVARLAKQDGAAELEAMATRFAHTADADTAAYAAVMAARRLPRASESERAVRTQRVAAAIVGAAEVPLALAHACTRLAQALRQLEAGAPAAIASDLTTARALTQAARDGALANVAINIESLPAAHPDRQRLLAALNQATRTPLFT